MCDSKKLLLIFWILCQFIGSLVFAPNTPIKGPRSSNGSSLTKNENPVFNDRFVALRKDLRNRLDKLEEDAFNAALNIRKRKVKISDSLINEIRKEFIEKIYPLLQKPEPKLFHPVPNELTFDDHQQCMSFRESVNKRIKADTGFPWSFAKWKQQEDKCVPPDDKGKEPRERMLSKIFQLPSESKKVSLIFDDKFRKEISDKIETIIQEEKEIFDTLKTGIKNEKEIFDTLKTGIKNQKGSLFRHLYDGRKVKILESINMIQKREKRLFEEYIYSPYNMMKMKLSIDRSNIFIDSYNQLKDASDCEIQARPLRTAFKGEYLDEDVAINEWYTLLSMEMVNEKYHLLKYSSEESYFAEIDPKSREDDYTLSQFKFIGRFYAMSILYDHFLPVCLTKPFLKQILKKKIELIDVKEADPDWHRAMERLLSAKRIEAELSFTVGDQDLIPDGKNIAITESNKEEYVRLAIAWKYYGRVQKQMKEFLDGFYALVPYNLIKRFNEKQLELLLCGEQLIDVDDWKKHTQLIYFTPESPTIIMFWDLVNEFDNKTKSKLLQFVRGTSRLPPGGFKNVKILFSICPSQWPGKKRYPQADTCFGQLLLPPYETKEEMRKYLLEAINYEPPIAL